MAYQEQIAHSVQDFVFSKLIVIAQAVGIEHTVVIQYDGIFQTATHGQTMRAHHFHITGEAKRAGSRDIARVNPCGHVKLHVLPRSIYSGVGKINLKPQLVAMVGL